MSVMKVIDLFSIFKLPISEQVREYYRILFDADSYADLLSVDGDQCVPIIRNVAKRLRGYDIDIEELENKIKEIGGDVYQKIIDSA